MKKNIPPPVAATPPGGVAAGWLICAARIILGAALAYSGTLKIAGPAEEFAVVIEHYRLLPDGMILTFATMMPWLEVLFGVSLALGYRTRISAAGVGGLLGMFILALLSTKLRGIELPNCGCFGQGLHLSAWQAIGLDSALSACAFLSFKWGAQRASLDNWIEGGL